jgi:uncharacterized repeat protein (TIGR03899 family)
MAFDDVLGIGKVLPIDKLLDILSKTVGRVSKSYFDKKDAESKAYEITMIAKAKADELRLMSDAINAEALSIDKIAYKDSKVIIGSNKSLEDTTIPNDLEERTHNRLQFQNAKKQLNVESITAAAADELKFDKEPIDEKYDENWTNRFFRIAEDISDEEMQKLWGRILAGELKSPKSYSLRTLEFLKNLSKEEAEIFIKFADLSISNSGKTFLLNYDKEELLEKKYKLTINDRLLLEELGLLNSSSLSFTFSNRDTSGNSVVFVLGQTCVILKREEPLQPLTFKILAFTKMGHELIKLTAGNKPELDYIQLLASKIKQTNNKVSYGSILSDDGDFIRHTDLIEVPEL